MKFALLLLLTAVSTFAADLGLMHNFDGDLSFRCATPEASVLKLKELIDDEAKQPVKTVCWSIGAGSDILYYPTKVASNWGWRHTKYSDDPKWKTRIEKCRIATDAGLDAPRIVGERLHEHGLRFVPSYRMNDGHFTSDPLDYPLTGRFWMEHQDATIGKSPVAAFDGYKHLLNYARDEVRAYRLAVIFEAMDRYADIMDGFELDFNRFQIFFPPGDAKRGGLLITEMLKQVRARLNDCASKQKRAMPLIVRVPPALTNCAWSGLEVEKWMQQRLVDVVIPSPLMTLPHDMPIDEFVRIAKPAGVQIIGSIYGRGGYNWPFSADHHTAAYSKEVTRDPDAAQVLGSILNQLQLGADGIQLFNFSIPSNDAAMLAAIQHERLGDRRYQITQSYFHDSEDSYEYRKQLPVALKPGATTKLRLLIGEDLSKAHPSYVGLRLGLYGANNAFAPLAMRVSINGHVFHDGDVAKQLVVTTGKRHGNGSHPPPTEAYVQWPVTELSQLHAGWNDIEVALLPKSLTKPLQLVEAEIGVVANVSK